MRYWWQLALASLVGAAAAVAVSYAFERVYRAEVLAVPVVTESQGGLTSLAAKYGALANVVGLDFDGGGNTSTAKTLAILQSRQFIEQFIRDLDLMPVLFPRDKGNGDGSTKDRKHTTQDAYRLFTRSILLVKQDNLTKLITVQVDWSDRIQAAAWANELVRRVNAVTREHAISEANRSLEFLRSEYDKADFVNLRQSISSLIETQINKKTMANTRPDYALEVLDPAQSPDANKSVSPKRIFFLVAGGLLGFIVTLALLVYKKQPAARARSDNTKARLTSAAGIE
jgi:uncharacterized protein involved in exopolysaccharide biosynthesis